MRMRLDEDEQETVKKDIHRMNNNRKVTPRHGLYPLHHGSQSHQAQQLAILGIEPQRAAT